MAGTSQALQELRRRCNKLRPRVHCCMISCFRRRLLFYCSCCRWGEQDIAIPVAGTLPARQQSPLWGLSPRPYAYEAHALPAELRRQVFLYGCALYHLFMTLCVYFGFSRHKHILKLGSVIVWQSLAGTPRTVQQTAPVRSSLHDFLLSPASSVLP